MLGEKQVTQRGFQQLIGNPNTIDKSEKPILETVSCVCLTTGYR